MRISKEEWAMDMARVTAKRSTCVRRNVGCVLLDEDWHVLSTGVNGVATGMAHCNQNTGPVVGKPPTEQQIRAKFPNACPGAFAESGTNLDGCYAIHAEQNALLQCPDVRKIHICVCTASPCITCVKLLMNTGCKIIIFDEAYPHNTAEALWLHQGRLWFNINKVTPYAHG